MKKILTLCIVQKGQKVLLGMKKRGFGAGRWNGFGGKIEGEESIQDGACRELKEEAGLHATEIEKRGIIDFKFENDPKILEVHIFSVPKYRGKAKETEEMKPEWFDVEKIPFDQMWADDKHWLPLFISGRKFKGEFLFDKPATPNYAGKIISRKLVEVKEI